MIIYKLSSNIFILFPFGVVILYFILYKKKNTNLQFIIFYLIYYLYIAQGIILYNTKSTHYNKINIGFKSDIANKQTNILELESKLQAQQTKNKKQENDILELQKYFRFYLKSEASRIRKKKVENKTEEEILGFKQA